MGVCCSNPSAYGQHERLQTAVAKSNPSGRLSRPLAALLPARTLGPDFAPFANNGLTCLRQFQLRQKPHTLTGNSPEIVPFGAKRKALEKVDGARSSKPPRWKREVQSLAWLDSL